MALISRRRFLGAAGVTAAATLALGGYATAYESGLALDLTRYAPDPPDWPADLPLRIAVIADIHACDPWMGEARIADIVAMANAEKPDLVVLLGDFVCTHRYVTGYVAPGAWAAELARLEAPLGVYAILGNHDWWFAAIPTDPPDNSLSIRRALAQARIPVLENQSLRLSQRGRPFWLIGLGDQLAFGRRGHHGGADDLPAALRELDDDAPAILLAHEPFVFHRTPDRVALTLSGHTHGGQVNFPLVGPPLAFSRSYNMAYVYGQYQRGRQRLIVSGGLGTSYAPIRFLRPPEVVIVDLGGETPSA
jgi:predicted MPP superfamily phosphohydrolase